MAALTPQRKEEIVLAHVRQLAHHMRTVSCEPRDFQIELIASINELFENEELPYRLVQLGAL